MGILDNIKTHIAMGRNYGGKRSTSNIKYIVIHYTGNDGDSDENNAKYFHNNYVGASAHYFVDDDSITQSVPDDYVAYAVGGKRQSSNGGTFYRVCTNSNSISIELCDNKKDGTIYPTQNSINNALELTRYLMRKYNVPKNRVIRHYDVNGKSCPSYWTSDKRWKNEFWNKLDSTASTVAKPTITESPKITFIKDVQRAIGAKVDGIAGSETLSKTITVSESVNRRHAVVKPIQTYLNTLGYNCGTADGIAGAKFDSAVKSYQKNVLGYKNPDGEITAKGKTWKSLLGM